MEYDAVIQNISLTGIMGVYVSFGDSNQQQGFVSYPNLKTKQQKKLHQGIIPGTLTPGSHIRVKLIRSSNGYNDLAII